MGTGGAKALNAAGSGRLRGTAGARGESAPDARFPRVERDLVEWLPAGASAPVTISVRELLRPI